MCGIIGIYKSNGKDVSADIYDGLIQVQHRGQDASGISTWNKSKIHMHKNLGLVSEVFKEEDLVKLNGNIGIGHVRYPTAGCDDVIESQPFYTTKPISISLAHNGTLINSDDIKSKLIKTHFCQFNTDSDSEVILNIFAHELQKINSFTPKADEIFLAVQNMHKRLKGAYSIVLMISGVGLLAIRDPNGIRPLIMGKKENDLLGKTDYMFASESPALDALDFEITGDLKPVSYTHLTLPTSDLV